jgi:hypothetical protein
MHLTNVKAGRWAVCAALLLATLLALQVVEALAAGVETYAMPQVIAQVPTPTPFRFLTPTPFAPGVTTTAPTPRTTPPPAGGFPMELAIPALAGGLAAIGGGSLLFRRKTNR